MSQRHILVVEDSATERGVYQRALEARGFRVSVAQDGEEGLRAARAERPDLVLLDVVMPGSNGFQVCRSLKSDDATRAMRVVIVTSKNQEADKFWALKQGADDFLKKPVSEDDLLASVRRQLQS